MPKVHRQTGPTLPRDLLERLGIEGREQIHGSKNLTRVNRGSRKEQRKIGHLKKNDRIHKSRTGHEAENDLEAAVDSGRSQLSSASGRETLSGEPPSKRRRTSPTFQRPNAPAPVQDQGLARDLVVTTVKSSIVPKNIRRQLEADDAEINALERKLGLSKSRALPQSFHDDGLGELIEGLEGSDTQTDASFANWLTEKRAKKNDLRSALGGETHDTKGTLDYSKGTKQFSELPSTQGYSTSEDDESASSQTTEVLEAPVRQDQPARKAYENPYVAPVSVDTQGKYKPPYRRDVSVGDTSETKLLRRRLQGLLNKLSDSNIISILSELESFYTTSPRQVVTTTLIDLLMALISDTMILEPAFVILHAGFLAATYRVVGLEFGAQLLQRLLQELNLKVLTLAEEPLEKRKRSNIIALISELYNFNVIGSRLLYDLIVFFVNDFSETSVDMLLKILRASGRDLRQDDPAALSDVVQLMRGRVAALDHDSLSVRTRFMMEMIENLKDSKVKAGLQSASTSRELVLRLRKTLSVLNTRANFKSEPLGIGLDDLRNIDRKGKWWLVGASYREAHSPQRGQAETQRSRNDGVSPVEDSDSLEIMEPDLASLAQVLHMNNDIRRAIFTAIMSAPDHEGAYHRLQKLRLKKTQELEIPRVIVRCCVSEATYNPYYVMIALQLCNDRKLKMAFQFVLWDLLQQMGEAESASKQDSLSIGLAECVSLAKFYGTLVAEKALGLNILKNLNLFYLHGLTKIFVEVLILTIFRDLNAKARTHISESSMESLCLPLSEFPVVLSGLAHFVKSALEHTDVAESTQELSAFSRFCEDLVSISENMVVKRL